MRALLLIRYFPLILSAIRLTWGLFLDRRVGIKIKLLPILAIIYVLSPLDLLPDIIPVVGWVDDLILSLGRKEPAFRDAAYGALKTLTGKNLYQHPLPWKQWWALERPTLERASEGE